MIKSFRSLTKTEFIIWAVSVAVVLVSNLVTGKADPITVAATLVGVTSLIFIAKGNVFGQFLTIVFFGALRDNILQNEILRRNDNISRNDPAVRDIRRCFVDTSPV